MQDPGITYLLRQYFQDRATDLEQDKLAIALDANLYEEQVKQVMDEVWYEHKSTREIFTAEKSRAMFTKIVKSRQIQGAIHSATRPKWYYAAAAVVLIAVCSALLYQFNNNQNNQSNIVRSTSIGNDVKPGGNRASLILADKSIIQLDNLDNGLLAEQGFTKVVKLQSGHLQYIPAPVIPAENIYNEVRTPRGGQYQVTLPDGSNVWLNSASSIRYPVAFSGDVRKVELSGEGYFDVSKNSSMPFIVSVAGKGEIKVLGTKFNINAYIDESLVNATLLEGRIEVTGERSHDSKIMAPGEQVQFLPAGELVVQKDIDIDQVIAWKNGLFNFSNANLLVVLKQISRWYDVDVIFQGSIPDRVFEGELQRDLQLSQVLRILERNDVHFRLEDNKLVILK